MRVSHGAQLAARASLNDAPLQPRGTRWCPAVGFLRLANPAFGVVSAAPIGGRSTTVSDATQRECGEGGIMPRGARGQLAMLLNLAKWPADCACQWDLAAAPGGGGPRGPPSRCQVLAVAARA
jgi:hypothetical protein